MSYDDETGDRDAYLVKYLNLGESRAVDLHALEMLLFGLAAVARAQRAFQCEPASAEYEVGPEGLRNSPGAERIMRAQDILDAAWARWEKTVGPERVEEQFERQLARWEAMGGKGGL